MAMEIHSPAFKHLQDIPKEYTCLGKDMSPELIWSGTPPQAKSLVLIVDDPDAPAGIWVHWLVYDIPAKETGMAKGIPKTPTLPSGAKQGTNSFSTVGYGGPCPPPGPKHRYFFKLYAISTLLNLPPESSKTAVLKAMQPHIVGEAKLIGYFGR